MATYAIGDIQGCHATLLSLLQKIRFDPRGDRLWLCGDLVNRGPSSLEVLRWARGLGDRVVAVLGNHDLHLLARWRGVVGAKPRDTLDEVLAAPDRDVLCEWLRERPLLYREGDLVLVHAGLLPSWTVEDAERLARGAEAELRGDGIVSLLSRGPRDPVVGPLTRIRTVRADGSLCDHAGPPAEAPPGCVPWFDVPSRRSRDATIIFGHWSALGLYVAPGLYGLDTGCVWGRTLTALRLDDRVIFQQERL